MKLASFALRGCRKYPPFRARRHVVFRSAKREAEGRASGGLTIGDNPACADSRGTRRPVTLSRAACQSKEPTVSVGRWAGTGTASGEARVPPQPRRPLLQAGVGFPERERSCLSELLAFQPRLLSRLRGPLDG